MPVWDVKAPMEFINHHLTAVPPPPSERNPDVPADVEAVLLRCLEKEPQRRFGSAVELRDALRACAGAGAWTDADAAAWWAQNR